MVAEVGRATACRLLATVSQMLRPRKQGVHRVAKSLPDTPSPLPAFHAGSLLDMTGGWAGRKRRENIAAGEKFRERTEHSQASMMSCG